MTMKSIPLFEHNGSSDLRELDLWLQSRGMRAVAELDIVDSGHSGRGIKTLRHLEVGDEILRIPMAAILTTPDVLDSPLGDAARQFGWQRHGSVSLMAMLVYLRTVGLADWQPLMRALPQEITTPLDFTQSELEEFQCSKVKAMITARQADIDGLYETFLAPAVQARPNLFGAADEVTLRRLFRWAYKAVNTRAFTARFGAEFLTGLVPLLDMLNHRDVSPDYQPATFSWDAETAEFVCTAQWRHAPGDEVFDSYGERDNADLLTFYGFYTEDNPNEGPAVSFKLRPLPVPNMHTIMKDLGLTPDFVGRFTPNGPTRELMNAARYHHLQPDEFSSLSLLLAGQRVSWSNEREAVVWLLDLAESRLAVYPTSLSDDTARLASIPPGAYRVAVGYRVEQKKSLMSCITSLVRRLEMLDEEG